MARVKQSQRALVQHEILGFVHFGVTLKHCPLAHLLHSPEGKIFFHGRVGYLLKAWSFIKRVYWDFVRIFPTIFILVSRIH